MYNSQYNITAEQALHYTKTCQSLSRYLMYRDIPAQIAKYVKGTNTLDYGCGTGVSTQFLLGQNLNVTGIDKSEAMLAQATINCPQTTFHLVKDGHLPFSANTFDLVFSSLVLFEIGTEEEMLSHLKEAKRVMKKDGILIALTGSEVMYAKDWCIYDANYPENKNLKSGDLAKLYLRDAAIEFTDFYWSEEDYHHFFNKAGFQLLEVHYPLGKQDEPYPWKDELTHSPFVIFVARV